MTALSLILTVGVRTVFSACGPKDDGSWMTCHWAEQAVFMAGTALTVVSVVVLICGSDRAALGASLSAIPTAIVTILIPDIAIKLCMMPTMHCHTVMRPAVIVTAVLITVTAAVNSAVLISRSRRKSEVDA